MAKITGTFDKLWNQGMADDARKLGVIDGDLLTVRSRVKALFVSAGWAQPDGTVEFVTEQDAANALQAAREVVEKTSTRLAAERKVVRAHPVSAGTTPTKMQVLSGNARPIDHINEAGSSSAVLHSTGAVATASFNPKMGQVGDRCPRCHGSMEPVGLVNERGALYCSRDRVVQPLPDGTQVRY